MAGVALRRGVCPGYAAEQHVHELIQQHLVAVNLLHLFHDAAARPVVVGIGQPVVLEIVVTEAKNMEKWAKEDQK